MFNIFNLFKRKPRSTQTEQKSNFVKSDGKLKTKTASPHESLVVQNKKSCENKVVTKTEMPKPDDINLKQAPADKVTDTETASDAVAIDDKETAVSETVAIDDKETAVSETVAENK